MAKEITVTVSTEVSNWNDMPPQKTLQVQVSNIYRLKTDNERILSIEPVGAWQYAGDEYEAVMAKVATDGAAGAKAAVIADKISADKIN